MFEEKLLSWGKESVNYYNFCPKTECHLQGHSAHVSSDLCRVWFHMFDSNVTLCAWYQLVLGHQSLAESLDYSYIKLKGFGQAGRFGRFDAELRDTVMMDEGSSMESGDEE